MVGLLCLIVSKVTWFMYLIHNRNAELQIRGGIEDNTKLILFLKENML